MAQEQAQELQGLPTADSSRLIDFSEVQIVTLKSILSVDDDVLRLKRGDL